MSIALSSDTVFFYGIHEHPQQKQVINVTNISLKPQRVRVSLPKTQNFRIDFQNLPIIAPGMSLPLTIELHAQNNEPELADLLVVKAADCSLEVPIKATNVFSRLFADNVDFGTVATNSEYSRRLTLRNEGNGVANFELNVTKVEGEFSLAPGDENLSCVSLNPACGSIEPFSAVEIEVELLARNETPLLALIEVGQLELTLSASIVRPRLVLTQNGKLVTESQFNELFFSEQSQCYELCNVSPFAVSYDASVVVQQYKCQTEPLNDARVQSGLQKMVSVVPQKGVLGPNSQEQLRIVFSPQERLEKAERINSFMRNCGFEAWQRIIKGVDYELVTRADDEQLKQYGSEFALFRPGLDDMQFQADVLIASAYCGQQLESQRLQLQCTAKRPLFVFSESRFSFQRGQIESLEIKSMNHYPCAMQFVVPCGFRLNCDSNLTFQPKESRVVQIMYRPNSLSDFNAFLHVNCGNEMFNVNIQLVCSRNVAYFRQLEQSRAAVESNVPKPALPVELANTLTLRQMQKQQAAESLGMDGTYKLAKAELARSKNYQRLYCRDADASSTDSSDAEDNGGVDAYNDFLDLGMGDIYPENNYEYQQISNAVDKAQVMLDKNLELLDNNMQPKKRPGLENAETAANKIYTQNQFDSAEFAKIIDQCQTKLLQKQYSILSTGTHTFDFGDVSVGSEMIKYFKIANDLQQYIKIELVTNNKESEKIICKYEIIANPEFLPPGCYTSFGIRVVFSEIEEKFYDTIDVLINNQLFIALTVEANIRRPQLTSNVKLASLQACEELIARASKTIMQPKFDLAAIQDCIFFTLTQENAFERQIYYKLSLTNTGTTDAQIFLQLQEETTDLIVEASENAIPVGQTTDIKILWVPGNGVACNILEISFLKGASYYVPIICREIPGDVSISEKVIDLGLINVSKEISSTVTLVNKSEHFHSFFKINVDAFNKAEQLLDLEVDCSNGEISAGESLPTELVFTAKNLGVFNIPLTIELIGGEMLQISIKGSVETAYVEIDRYEFASSTNTESLDNTQTSEKSETERESVQDDSNEKNSVMISEAEINLSNVVVNLESEQKIQITNKGKVPAGIFIDASFTQFVSLQESQDNNVIFKQYTRKEMLSLFESFKGDIIQGGKLENKSIALDEQDTMNQIAQKYNLPCFKNAQNGDYSAFNEHLMNNINLNELYGGQIVKEQIDSQKLISEEILYAYVPVGCSCSVTCLINVDEIIENCTESLYFWVLGQQYGNMTQENAFTYSNELVLQFSSEPAILTISNCNVDFGIKVADKSFKQSSSKVPLTSKQLYKEIADAMISQGVSNDEIPEELPFLRYMSDSGLYSTDLTLTNTTSKQVRFCIIPYQNNEMLQDGMNFMFTQTFGIINPCDTCQIRIYFSPSEVGEYEANVNIYYSEDEQNEFFTDNRFLSDRIISIEVQGVAIHKNIVFDNQIMFFPNTAINVASRICLNVYNVGYKENTRLSLYLPPELSKIAFNVIWPFGNVINHMIKTLPVVISFISAFPISFKSRISILDDENVPYNLEIAGNAYSDDFELVEYRRHLGELGDAASSAIGAGLPTSEQPLSINYFEQTQLDNAQLHALGLTKSYILALRSINARPLIEFSEYAVSQGFDSLYKLKAVDYLKTDYILVNPCTVIEKLDAKAQDKLQTLKKFVCGPFMTSKMPSYDHCLSRIQFYFMNSFKRSTFSEVPFTPFFPQLTDLIDFDEKCNQQRLEALLNTLTLLTGLKITSFPGYFTQVTNREQQFLIFCISQYKNLNYTSKQASELSVQEDFRVEFLASAFESVINAMKINGAMLNNIHFSLLLEKNDFVAYAKKTFALLSINSYTVSNQLPEHVNAIISEGNSQLISDLLLFIHKKCHKSAWFFVLEEMVRIELFEGANQLVKYEEAYKQYILGECSEFNLKRNLDQEIIKRDCFVNFFSKYVVKSKDSDELLEFIQFFANFELFGHSIQIKQSLQYKNLYSGVEIALTILSFSENLQLVEKLEDLFTLCQKFADCKLQRDITDFDPADFFSLVKRPPEATEKLWIEFDVARKDLWKEICEFTIKNFNYECNVDMFYSCEPDNKEFDCHIYNIKILASILYESLLSFIPIKTLNVNAFLEEELSEQIDVSNQYKEELKYNISLVELEEEKSCELEVSTNSILIDAKNTTYFDLKIKPNYLKNTEFLILLTPNFEGVKKLELPSVIFVNVTIADKCEKEAFEMEIQTGELQRLELPISNMSTLLANYSVKIEEKFYPVDISQKQKINNLKEGKSVLAFKCEKEIIVKPNEEAKLNVEFSPAHPGLYMANIKLTDENLGTESFEIKGFSLLPDSEQVIKITQQISDIKTIVIKAEDLNLLDALSKTEMMKFAIVSVQNECKMQCEFKKDSFILQLLNKNKVLPEEYLYKLIVLTDSSTRVYEILLNILQKVKQEEIEMTCAANTETYYTTTVQNNDEVSKTYVVQLKTEKSEYYLLNSKIDLNQLITLGPGQKQSIEVQFKPAWIYTGNAELIIQDEQTEAIIQDYFIEASGTEPKEMGNIEIKSEILEETEYILKYQNTTEKDAIIIPQFGSNSEIFKTDEEEYAAAEGQLVEIKITAEHYVSGKYETRLELRHSGSEFYDYFNITYLVLPRNCSGDISIECRSGETASSVAKIVNQSEAISEFYVSIEGIPKLLINVPKTIELSPQTEEEVKIIFAPYCACTYDGKIKFSSENCGEFWFNLKVKATEPEVEILKVQGQIGSGITSEIKLKNTICEEQVAYKCTLSNQDSFKLNINKIVLKYNEQETLLVSFEPEKFNEVEESMITILGYDQQNNLIYQRLIKILGSGYLEQEDEHLTISAQLNQGVSGHIEFKNPFLTRASVKFEYDEQEELEFQCKEELLEPGQVTYIQYIYIPKRLQTQCILFEIQINPTWDIANSQYLTYNYQILCIGEYTHKQPIAFLEVPAREFITKTVSLPQEIEIDDYDSIDIEFYYSGEVVDEFANYQSLINSTLSASFEEAKQTALIEELPEIGRRNISLTFEPLKPFSADCMLILKEKMGGQYKLPIQLFADEPEIEGTITVELPNGKEPGSYVLECRNCKNVYSEYRAYFSPGSSIRFSVTPDSGILEPGNSGIQTIHSGRTTKLEIKCENGNSIARGELIVETRDVLFIWKVVSGFKKYIPPSGVTKIAIK